MTIERAIKEIRKFERCHYEKPNGDADLKVYEALRIAIDCMKTILMISKYEPELEWDDDMYVIGRNSMLNDIQEDIKDIWSEVE